MPKHFALPVLAALAACSTQPAPDKAEATRSATTNDQTAQPGLDAAAPASPIPVPVPSTTAAPGARYIGRWAAKEELCGEGAWRFEPRHLATAGEVSCDFRQVREVPGGYDLDATCTAEGSTSNETIKLRFAESAKAMLVESKTFRPIGLIPCPGEATPEPSPD